MHVRTRLIRSRVMDEREFSNPLPPNQKEDVDARLQTYRMQQDFGRVAASTCILVVSTFVLFIACQRASTIYFFELDSSIVFFVSKRHAFGFPLILSAILYGVYLATRRNREAEKEREREQERIQMEARSRSSSRKPSRVLDPPNSRLLGRLLSDIQENDGMPAGSTAESISGKSQPTMEKTVEEEPSEANSVFGEDDEERLIKDDDGGAGPSHLLVLPTLSGPPSRKTSTGSKVVPSSRVSRKNSLSDEPPVRACDVYRELGETDLMSYAWFALSVFPQNEESFPKRKIRIADFLAEFVAVHVPIWLCVAALHVVLLELITVKFAFYFYYHEETMQYSALVASILFGVLHEFAGGWLSNDVLAFSSIYVVVSRIQLVSYQTGIILSVGLIAFDLFWIYGIDLLSTVTGSSRAPLMIVVPRDNEGHKQSLATLDIMAPGVFLNVMLKYSSMYDPRLYAYSFYATVAGLIVTMILAIYRKKITPALVLPLIGIVVTSATFAEHPYDLWRFMIKH